jgi:aryl-alcohol dehydrogenase-like predicted oxidoreductase
MERRRLGPTGMEVGAVGLGTWKAFNVTSPEDKAACRAVVDEAVAGGADLFDSSPMYGHAEHVLAECLLGRRERAVVATKVWASSAEEARRQMRDATTYFGGVVDLYQVHNLSLTRQVLDLFAQAREVGQLRAVGVTHYQREKMPDVLAWMESGEVETVQVPYSLHERTVEEEVLPAAERLGIGVVGMMPLEQGRLAMSPPPARKLAPFEEYGCTTWPQVALKWVLSDPRVTAVIPATRNAQHMRENVVAGKPPWFDEDTRKKVLAVARG